MGESSVNDSQNIVQIQRLKSQKKCQTVSKGHIEANENVSIPPLIKVENLDEISTSIVNIVDQQVNNASEYQSAISQGKIRKYQCEKCNYASNYRGNYIRHNWYVHNTNL